MEKLRKEIFAIVSLIGIPNTPSAGGDYTSGMLVGTPLALITGHFLSSMKRKEIFDEGEVILFLHGCLILADKMDTIKKVYVIEKEKEVHGFIVSPLTHVITHSLVDPTIPVIVGASLITPGLS